MGVSAILVAGCMMIGVGYGGSRPAGIKSAKGDVIGDESNTKIVINNEINGNGNTINQDIVIQVPKGDGTGMQGNAEQMEAAGAL